MKQVARTAKDVAHRCGLFLLAGTLASHALLAPAARGQAAAGTLTIPATLPTISSATLAPTTNPVAGNSGVTMPLIPGMAGAPYRISSATTRPIQDDLLGKPFTSASSGIGFQPPAGSRQIQPKGENQIVEFDTDIRDWSLIVSKMPPPPRDQVLTTRNGHTGTPYIVTDAPVFPHTQPTTRSVTDPGVMEQYLNQLKISYGVLDIRRNETINAGRSGLIDMGVIAVQYTIGGQRQLKQIAIVQANPRQFYVLELTSPGSDNPDSPLLRDAAATFGEITDSVVLNDQSPLREEQNTRIIHTGVLFAHWTEANIDAVLLPQRYLRIVRNGKDVGYVYATEQPMKEAGSPAVRIAMRIHHDDGIAKPTDSQTIMISTIDYHHTHEQWSTLLTVPNPNNPKPDEYSEIGASDYTADIPVPAAPGTATATGGFALTSRYNLTVTGSLPDTGPEHRDIALPRWYLPQALQYLLPRIVMHNTAGNAGEYLFYTWVPSTHEVMLLYCDVLPANRLRFNGQMVTAIQIKTHITLDGPVTTDYIDLAGNYLGAESDRVDAKNITTQELVVPCDADTLTKIWGHPNLTNPGDDRSSN